MGLAQRAIGAGSLQARVLITRQLSHLPTPKQSAAPEKQEDRELRLRGHLGGADHLSG